MKATITNIINQNNEIVVFALFPDGDKSYYFNINDASKDTIVSAIQTDLQIFRDSEAKRLADEANAVKIVQLLEELKGVEIT